MVGQTVDHPGRIWPLLTEDRNLAVQRPDTDLVPRCPRVISTNDDY